MRLTIQTFLVAAVCWVITEPAAAQSPMQKVQLVRADSLASLSWTSVAEDPRGDLLHARLPDARDLSYAVDAKSDLIWFKVGVYEPLPERWFGISVAIDADDDAENGMTWWGTNKSKFDRLACAFLFKADDYWQGYAGVGDSESVSRGYVTNLSRDVKVAVDREQRTVFLGVARAAFGATASIRVLATVGSMLANNDDVPNERMISIKLKP
jgi:hypothetical protein